MSSSVLPGSEQTLRLNTVVEYLLDQGLISLASIVDGRVVVKQMARRNRGIEVLVQDGDSYFLKQPDATQPRTRETVRVEAAVYARLQGDPRYRQVASLLPRLVNFDEAHNIIVTEFLEDATTLREFVSPSGMSDNLPVVGFQLGKALATLHSCPVPRQPWIRRDPPWVVGAHRVTPAGLQNMSAANYRVIGLVQQSHDMTALLEVLGAEWSVTGLVHGDIKSDNWLLLPRDGTEVVEIRLVDWELCQAGDPAWDVGCALVDLLLIWLTSIPGRWLRDLDEAALKATFSLAVVQAGMRALWYAYRTSMARAEPDARRFLGRSVAWTVARLIQATYEYSIPMDSLGGYPALFLQVAANIARDPERAAVELFGMQYRV